MQCLRMQKLFSILVLFKMLVLLSAVHLRRMAGVSPTNPHPQVNPYNFTCTREKIIDGTCRWCNREVPGPVQGFFAPLAPYWQYPGKCNNQAFDHEDTKKCLAGRTLYVIGNSVARQTAFNVIEMLGGNPVQREDQRDMCPKHETTWGDSCHSEFAGLKVRYLFLQFGDGMYYNDRQGFPFFRFQEKDSSGKMVWKTGKISYIANNTETGQAERKFYNSPKDLNADYANPLWEYDNCISQSTRSCLATFFEGAKEKDLLMFALGMSYYLGAAASLEPTQAVGIDYRRWLLSSAAAFKSHIAATFPGQVFRATLAEMKSDSTLSYSFGRVNNLVNEIWGTPSAEGKPWYTIDQWAINHGRPELYNDHIHFNGPLTFATITQILNELCPGGGKDTWRYPADGNMTTAFEKLPKAYVIDVQTSSRSHWYMVLYKGVRHHIPDMDTYEGLDIPEGRTIQMTEDDLKYFPEGEPVPSCDKSYVPNVCPNSVYYKALHFN
jgi:hypothetical protein